MMNQPRHGVPGLPRHAERVQRQLDFHIVLHGPADVASGS